jgi:hypothetical protein
MHSHPLNLALIFLLELAALAGIGYWGWQADDSVFRYVLCMGLPTVAALIWGIFRVPNDPGKATVVIPGWLRLILEFTYFTIAVILLTLADKPMFAAVMAGLVILHYTTSYDRIRWLLRTPS